MEISKLTEEQKEKIVRKFHGVVMELMTELDSPETIYLMARALSSTAIMQNALNDAAQ